MLPEQENCEKIKIKKHSEIKSSKNKENESTK